MTMNTNPDISLDDVLEELALTSAKPDARVLGEFARRYPQYTDEIMEFAAELAALAMADEPGDGLEPSTTETSPAVSKAMSAPAPPRGPRRPARPGAGGLAADPGDPEVGGDAMKEWPGEHQAVIEVLDEGHDVTIDQLDALIRTEYGRPPFQLSGVLYELVQDGEIDARFAGERSGHRYRRAERHALVRDIERALGGAVTPGPWRTEPKARLQGGAVSADVASSSRQVALACGEAAVHDERGISESEIVRANAALIAAAPELLRRAAKELRRLRGIEENHERCCEQCQDRCYHQSEDDD